MSESPEEIKKNVHVYLSVFISLATLTLVTVVASYLKLNPTATIIVALIIASIKGLLVAGYFMHLFSERLTIYLILALTAIFFFTVLLLPMAQHKGDLNGTRYTPVASFEAHHPTQPANNEVHHAT